MANLKQKLGKFDILWAPWRYKYLIKPSKGCFICKANSRSKSFIFETKFCKVLLNIFPYNNGHLLLAPKKHIKELNKLTPQEIQDIFQTLNLCIELLKETLNPEGFNVGLNLGRVAGAGLESHIHFHIVPRWKGDVNFLPIISNTKVISQSLEVLRKLLKNVYKKRMARF